MFNEFRDPNAGDTLFNDDNPGAEAESEQAPKRGLNLGFQFNSNNFLGMTASQRFVLSFMLMLVVLILGSLMLLVLGKIQPF